MTTTHNNLNIGFLSFRFAGTDGVSLETAKWAKVLESFGHTCFYFSGASDRPTAQSMVVPEAFYQHPEVLDKHTRFFSGRTRTAEDTRWIHLWTDHFRMLLSKFIHGFSIDLLIPQNLLCIPLHIPFALALTELIAETGLPTIAHHHDFAWERKRFLINGVSDYLAAAFPPDLPSIQHVVINSQGQQQLARRRGVSSVVVPNVMPFEQPAPQMDAYSADLRDTIGVKSDELFVLQPTRVIQRKGIEHAIELLAQIDRKAKLVITHQSGDEGDAYAARVVDYANRQGVDVLFCAERFDEQRGEDGNGRKIYSLWDAYPHADLITYPSLIEGFGNAFLEAIYFRKPIVINNYPVYATDINTKGFDVILFDEFVTPEAVAKTNTLLQDPQRITAMVEKNYQLGLEQFSFNVLRRKLRSLLESINDF